ADVQHAPLPEYRHRELVGLFRTQLIIGSVKEGFVGPGPGENGHELTRQHKGEDLAETIAPALEETGRVTMEFDRMTQKWKATEEFRRQTLLRFDCRGRQLRLSWTGNQNMRRRRYHAAPDEALVCRANGLLNRRRAIAQFPHRFAAIGLSLHPEEFHGGRGEALRLLR